jgi:transcriptional regulator with XRE-family HTH domain
MHLAMFMLIYTGGTELNTPISCVKLSVAPAFIPSAGLVRGTSGPPVSEQTSTHENNGPVKVESDRDVIRCLTCGMVQYCTRNGNCRRCLHLLKPKVAFLIPPPAPLELQGDDCQSSEKWPNRETLKNIGSRIRQLRESHGMTQTQLNANSGISRSYLSRIESGQMTPSLGTLEKISEALGVGLNRFLVPETSSETVLEDEFIQQLQPYLRQLDWAQWQSILKRLAAISDYVSARNGPVPSVAQPEQALIAEKRHRN